MGAKHKTVLMDVPKLRGELGLSQADFWGKLGISQSGGSRMEGQGVVSQAIYKLIKLQYILNVDVDTGEKLNTGETKEF